MIAPPPQPRPRRRAAVAGWLAFAVLLAGVVVDGLTHRTGVIVEAEGHPPSVRYEDGSAHYVGVIEKSSLLLGRHRAYELYAGRDSGLAYGHYVRLDLNGEPPEIESTQWDETGVQVIFASGHRVFVPARYYLGGR
ncbi:hypothetical protein [Actinomadura sp. WMMB 499]|uniref:hypothetical protein n=1 Tax=Actinomadura sp. WMMB 499 TaxID=1219491 RepID=UPI0012456401|nr:hypothetical protein [Actinomadura sp. WMMB 499]QFG26475.1 hypothetical protein F7P10_40405 [Actinomadura sp. WMMB 499]